MAKAMAARHSLTENVLTKELGKVTNWYEFGIALDMPVEVLDSIRRSNQDAGIEVWKIEMFKRWLNRTRTASWNDIIHALQKVGYHALADELTSIYIQQPQLSTSAVAPQSPDEVRTDRRVLLKLLNLQTCYGQMIAEMLGFVSEVDLGRVKMFLEATIGDRDFRGCSSLEDVLYLLIDKHIDIFNITRLEQLSNAINHNAMKDLVANYNKEKEKFLHEVAVIDFHREVASKVNYQVPYGEKAEVVIRIPHEYASPHGRTLKDMETLAGKAFGEYYQSFIRMTVKPGSILVVWQFPVSLSAKLEHSARDSSDLFAMEGVEVVMVAGRVVYTSDRKYRFPLEQMLDTMEVKQISELRHDLAKKENKMAQREKEMREELSKKEKELRDMLVKKDLEWMEKVEDLRSQLGKRDTEWQKAQEAARDLGNRSERYFVASVFLLLFVIACIGVAANRQFELGSWAAQYSKCALEVKELTKIAGECGKQHEELESCRKNLYDLKEERGKCIVYEEQIKGNTSLAVLKNAEFLMNEMHDYKYQAAANAEKRDLCEKHLRHVEGKMHQLIHNITVVVAENEKCKMSLNNHIANERQDMKTKTAPSPAPTGA